jgi:hypothetical protein
MSNHAAVPKNARTVAVVRGWRGTLAYGTLWGFAVLGMESVLQPVDAITREYAAFVLSLAPQLVALGICIAWLAILVERTVAWRWLPLVVAGMAVAAGAAMACGERLVYPLIGLSVLPRGQDSFSAFCYHAWTALFYGGLLLIGRVFALHGERVERLLARAELERSRREATLGEVRLQALQGSVEPRLMRDVLSDVQRRQHTDPAGAERLLDELVGFLRLAMPSLRQGASTLAAELALVQAYARMKTEQHGGGAPTWHLAADAGTDIAFPPLLLLPLLDVFGAAGQPSRGTLSVQRTDAGVHIALVGEQPVQADGAALDALTRRLEIGLRALHENRFDFRLDRAARSLRLLVRTPSPGQLHPPSATRLETSR